MSTISSPAPSSSSSSRVWHPPTPATKLSSLSIVLPCFNEEHNVSAAVRNALEAAAANSRDYEVIVVNDGSTDDTAGVTAALTRADPHVRLILHPTNLGYGSAMRSGIEAANMDWILLADADLQFDLRELQDFVPLTATADALWGRRILRQDTRLRRASAAAWNWLMHALFKLPVSDVDCGFKLIRRELLSRIGLETTGAMISTELAVRLCAEGARFAEIGVHHHPRVAGEETGGRATVIGRAFRELVSTQTHLRRLARG